MLCGVDAKHSHRSHVCVCVWFFFRAIFVVVGFFFVHKIFVVFCFWSYGRTVVNVLLMFVLVYVLKKFVYFLLLCL